MHGAAPSMAPWLQHQISTSPSLKLRPEKNGMKLEVCRHQAESFGWRQQACVCLCHVLKQNSFNPKPVDTDSGPLLPMTSDVSLLTLMTSMSVAVGGLHNAAKIEATISSASGGGGRGIGGGGRFNHLGLSIGSLGLSVGRHLEAPSVTEALAAMWRGLREKSISRSFLLQNTL